MISLGPAGGLAGRVIVWHGKNFNILISLDNSLGLFDLTAVHPQPFVCVCSLTYKFVFVVMCVCVCVCVCCTIVLQ